LGLNFDNSIVDRGVPDVWHWAVVGDSSVGRSSCGEVLAVRMYVLRLENWGGAFAFYLELRSSRAFTVVG